MHVCMCVAYVFACVHGWVGVYVCMGGWVCMCAWVGVYVCMGGCVCVHGWVCMCAWVGVYVGVGSCYMHKCEILLQPNFIVGFQSQSASNCQWSNSCMHSA